MSAEPGFRQFVTESLGILGQGTVFVFAIVSGLAAAILPILAFVWLVKQIF
ncbi:hypothetical protein HEQ69_10920 [Haematospirillum jordaniae]|uniref:hypothetical protein n=1 Tax=Haematospirillum jordaniae TaxID=1549855 RepID=UPI00143342BF|nr:hypothetical protein [Haematospirillum jordaniae]NKD46215.1 hypothetical protein [Haematospirillum jordaniae]